MTEPILAKIVEQDNEDRVRRGYSLEKEMHITCPSCNKLIFHIIKVQEADIKNTYILICPCGEKSFKIKIDGKVYHTQEDGLKIKKIDCDVINQNEYFTIIELENV